MSLALLTALTPDFGDYGEPSAAAGIFGCGFGLVALAIGLIMVVSMWKIYAKAGKPGWASIVPIYNIIVWLEIVGRPLLWIIVALIPIVNLILVFDLAKSFGKSMGFTIGMILLPIIFYPMLAFGDSTYQGPAAAKA